MSAMTLADAMEEFLDWSMRTTLAGEELCAARREWVRSIADKAKLDERARVLAVLDDERVWESSSVYHEIVGKLQRGEL